MALITSNGTGGGLASATTTWTGGIVPVEGDAVQILAGDTVTLDGVYIWGDDTTTAITVDGVLEHSSIVNSHLTSKGTITVSGTGKYQAGTSASRLPLAVTARLTLNFSAALANDKYPMEILAGGDVELWGDDSRNTIARTTAYSSGSLSSFAVDNITGWQVGDTIVLHHVSGTVNGVVEYRTTISSITGNVITIPTISSITLAANYIVANITKNIILESYTGTKTHIRFNHSGTSIGVSRRLSQVDATDIIGDGAPRYGISINTGDALDLNVYTFEESAFGGVSMYNTDQGITFTNSYIYKINRNRSKKDSYINCITTSLGYDGWGTSANGTWDSCAGVLFQSGGTAPFEDTYTNCIIVNYWYRAYIPSFEGVFTDCTFIRFAGRFLNGTWKTAKIIRSKYAVDYQNSNAEAVSAANHRLTYMRNLDADIDAPTWSVTALDDLGDPTFQWKRTETGLFVRDTVVRNSSVASIQVQPLSSINPTSYKIGKTLLAGVTTTATVMARKEAAFTAPYPSLSIKHSGGTITTSMTNINDTFVGLTVQYTAVSDEVIEIAINAIDNGHKALCWFDDFTIDGVTQDIGQALFTGGTEISNVIDITDTSKNVTLTGLIAGSDVVILQAGTNTVLDSVDQEPTTSWTFSNPTPITIDIGIIKPGYITQYIYGFVLDKQGATLPIKQVPDRSYQ